MDEKRLIRNLAAKARAEAPPRTRVADKVLATLAERRAEAPESNRPLLWVASLAAVAAIAVAMFALPAFQTPTDPILQLLEELPRFTP